MKSMRYVIGILLCVAMFPISGHAESGELKINIDINTQNEKREKTYIEQETELSQLFGATLSNQINKKQSEESSSYHQDKTLLFLSSGKQSLNAADTSTTFLSFNTSNNEIGVILRENDQPIQWINVIIIIIGCGIMSFSLLKRFKKKGEK